MTPYWFRNGIDIPDARASLAVLVAACVLPLATAAALLILNFYKHEQSKLTDSAISQARAIVGAADREFATTQAALQALATSNLLANGDLGGFYKQALAALQNIHAESIVVVDPSGQLMLNTTLPMGAPLPKRNNPQLLKHILETGKPGVSDLFFAKALGYFIFAIGVPVKHQGSIVYSLNTTMIPSVFSPMLTEQKFPSSWRVSILDSAGSIVARTHNIDQLLGRKIPVNLQQRISAADEGSFESKTLDGIPVLTVYSRSAASKWVVVLGIPKDELTAELNQTLGWLVIATLVALASGLVAARFIGRRIAGSITALIAPAMAIGSGKMPPLPRLYFREANELGQALRGVAQRLDLAQADMHESNQRLNLAANAAHLGIWIRDFVHGEIWASDQWRTMFGFSSTQAITLEDLLQRIHPDDRAGVTHTLTETQRGMREYDMEYRIELDGAGLRWIGSRGRIDYDTGGQALLARGVAFDITVRKQAELDLRQRQNEITHLSRVAMLGELSGALAHELNQPLTAILSNAQAAQRYLARDPVNLDGVRDILQDIVDEDKRASEVIRRMRLLLRSGAIERQAVSVPLLAGEVAKLLHSDLVYQGFDLHLECASDLPRVNADPVQMQQVLINLIMNACDAMEAVEGGERHITLRAGLTEHACVQVSVINPGAGIPADSIGKIFDAFYTTKAQGMGLGLSICRNIVEAMGGRLWCESNAEFTSFHFTVPLHTLDQT